MLKFPEGTYVKHNSKPIEGRVLGITRIKGLFERADDVFEYRVQSGSIIAICSESNLLPQQPKGRYSHCYRCQLQVDPMSVKCRNCGWYICADPRCKSCGCGVGRGIA